MKALLIDDERLARNELRRLLAAFSEIEIAGDHRRHDTPETRSRGSTRSPARPRERSEVGE